MTRMVGSEQVKSCTCPVLVSDDSAESETSVGFRRDGVRQLRGTLEVHSSVLLDYDQLR